jgi:hypothetical protein
MFLFAGKMNLKFRPMYNLKVKVIFKLTILIFILHNISCISFAQSLDTLRTAFHFSGAVTVTNKGISTIPNLTLGKPAAIFDLSAGKGRLSFEPQLRFALEGKPWSFLFWWRYKLVETPKFQFTIGAHPALSFRNKTFIVNEITSEELVVRRYLACELAPSVNLKQNFSLGLYYLYSRGIEKDITRNTNLIAFRGSISGLELAEKIFFRINPQFYYLFMDDREGLYFNTTIAISHKDFPVSLSALINEPIKTDIEAGNDFLWNVSLTYTFGKDYVGR